MPDIELLFIELKLSNFLILSILYGSVPRINGSNIPSLLFEIIPGIECDWGSHTVIQCPVCEELFSIDLKCPAFQTIEKLFEGNRELYSNDEQSSYLSEPHPF